MRAIYYPDTWGTKGYIPDGDNEWTYQATVTYSADGYVIDVDIEWDDHRAPELLDPVARKQAIRDWKLR